MGVGSQGAKGRGRGEPRQAGNTAVSAHSYAKRWANSTQSNKPNTANGRAQVAGAATKDEAPPAACSAPLQLCMRKSSTARSEHLHHGVQAPHTPSPPPHLVGHAGVAVAGAGAVRVRGVAGDAFALLNVLQRCGAQRKANSKSNMRIHEVRGP